MAANPVVVQELENKSDNFLTREQFEKALPKGSKCHVSDKFLKHVNNLIQDGTEREAYRDNMLAYTSVLKSGQYTLEAYANAVRYVGFKLTGDTNLLAFIKTFPARYQNMMDNNWHEKDINSRVSAYHKTQLVTKVLEASIVPSWILNQDLYQRALNVQADLMINARSEKVRTDAATSLLTHLKMPETNKIELDIGLKEDDAIKELKKSTLELVAMQKQMLKSGAMNANQIAKQKIIQGEVVSDQ